MKHIDNIMLNKIQSYKNNYKSNVNKSLNSFQCNPLRIKSPLRVDFISFTSNQTGSGKRYYDEFMDEYKKQYSDIPLEDTIKDIINTGEELNRGKEKKVFKFPKMEDYLIGFIMGKQVDKIPEIKPVEKMLLSKFDFGQPFASNNHNVIIMKQKFGVPNSVNDYHGIIKYISENNETTKEASKEYLSKLRIIKDFPQEAFDDLAEKLLYISSESDVVDFINPNNLLVDAFNKEFNLIDMVDMVDITEYCRKNNIPIAAAKLTHKLKLGKKVGTLFPMYSLVLDSKLQPYYLEKLDMKERVEVNSISKEVIKKCNAAVHKYTDNKKESSRFSKFVFMFADFVTKTPLNRRYHEFLDMYGLK